MRNEPSGGGGEEGALEDCFCLLFVFAGGVIRKEPPRGSPWVGWPLAAPANVHLVVNS